MSETLAWNHPLARTPGGGRSRSRVWRTAVNKWSLPHSPNMIPGYTSPVSWPGKQEEMENLFGKTSSCLVRGGHEPTPLTKHQLRTENNPSKYPAASYKHSKYHDLLPEPFRRTYRAGAAASLIKLFGHKSPSSNGILLIFVITLILILLQARYITFRLDIHSQSPTAWLL